jgi:hypothetical protein
MLRGLLCFHSFHSLMVTRQGESPEEDLNRGAIISVKGSKPATCKVTIRIRNDAGRPEFSASNVKWRILNYVQQYMKFNYGRQFNITMLVVYFDRPIL